MGLLIRAPEWVLLSLGSAAGVAGLFTVLWALAWDRAKGRRRCGRCWYDMAGTPGLRCPECGREARSEKALTRTRRRRWMASLGTLVIVVGGVLGAWPIVRARGAPGLLPTFVLVRLTPAVGKESWWDSHTYQEIATPIASEIARRAKANRLSPSDWLAAFQSAGVLRCRNKWPKDRPLVVGLSVPEAWAGFGTLHLVPRTPGLVGASAGKLGEWDGFGYPEASYGPRSFELEQHQRLGTVPPGTTMLEFDVTLTRRPDGSSAFIASTLATTTLKLGVWRVPIELVDTPEQAIPTAPDQFGPTEDLNMMVQWPLDHHARPSVIDITLASPMSPRQVSSRVGLGFIVELVLAGVVQDSMVVVHGQTDNWGPFGNLYGDRTVRTSLAFPKGTAALAATQNLRDWSIRLTPSAETLLECWDVDYVTGQYYEQNLADVWK